jgi:hypothetical protein
MHACLASGSSFSPASLRLVVVFGVLAMEGVCGICEEPIGFHVAEGHEVGHVSQLVGLLRLLLLIRIMLALP